MGINVKVSTKKVIAAMEQKVAANTKKLAEYEKANKQKEAAKEKYKKFVQNNAARIAKAAGSVPDVSVSEARSWGANAGKIQVELTYFLSPEDAKEIQRPDYEDERLNVQPHQLREENAELGNAIRLLNMTDEEYVSTSTYKQVAKYL